MEIYLGSKCISRIWRWFRRLSSRIRKIWHFIGLARRDFDWDYAYMLEMERAKLEYMAKYFTESQIAEHDWAVARDAKICIRLIDIIIGNDSSYVMKDNEKKPFMEWDLVEIKKVNLKNAERFLSKERIDRCSDDHPRMKVYLKDDLRIEKAWNLYCKIREYNMRSWWN